VPGHDRVQYRARHPALHHDAAEAGGARDRLVVVERIAIAADLGEELDVARRDEPGPPGALSDAWTAAGPTIGCRCHVLLLAPGRDGGTPVPPSWRGDLESMASLRRRRSLGHVGAKLRAYVEVFPIAPVGSQQLLPRFLRTARVTGLVPGRGLSPVRMAVLRDAAREGLGRGLRVSTTQGQLTTTELQ